MIITKTRIEKFSAPLAGVFTVASGTIDSGDSWIVFIETDAGITGIGAAAPWGPVTGETLESCYEVLKMLTATLPGKDPLDIGGIHQYMDRIIYKNGSAKCAIDTALYDIAARAAGLPLYKYLGATCGTVENDITVGIDEPQLMEEQAGFFVHDLGFRILKIKIGLNYEHDLDALQRIRKIAGPDVRIRVDANQGYTREKALEVLPAFQEIGIDAVEQFLPSWDFEGSAWLRANNPTKVKIMLDESIHDVHDAMRASQLQAADYFNIKLMKCGGIYYGLQIADIAAAANINCMVGCMMENKISLAAGLSLVAAKQNIVEADCDSFLVFKDNDDGIVGGFVRDGGRMILSDKPGLGIEL